MTTHTPELLALVEADIARLQTEDNTLVSYLLSQDGYNIVTKEKVR